MFNLFDLSRTMCSFFLGEPARPRIPTLEFVAPRGGLRTPSLLLAIFISVFPFCLYLSFFSCLSCGDKDEDNATYCDIYLSYFEDNDVAIFIFLMSFLIMPSYK